MSYNEQGAGDYGENQGAAAGGSTGTGTGSEYGGGGDNGGAPAPVSENRPPPDIGWGAGQVPPAPVADKPETLAPPSLPDIGAPVEVGVISQRSAPGVTQDLSPAVDPFGGSYDPGRAAARSAYTPPDLAALAPLDIGVNVPGTLPWADAQARAETIPGLGLTPERGFLGARERAVQDPVTGQWSAQVTWDPVGFLVDVASSVISFFVGGPLGLAAGIAANRVGNAVVTGSPMGLGFGDKVSMAPAAVPQGEAFGYDWNAGRAIGAGLVAAPAAEFGSPVTAAPAGVDDGTPAGGFDLSEETRAVADDGAVSGTVESGGSPWPGLLLAGAAAVELFS